MWSVWHLCPGESAARLTFFALYALQHRGQESAGIAVSDGQRASLYKEMGLVSQVFNEMNLRPLEGHIGIGHVRYSTKGSSRRVSAQPFLLESALGPVAVAHNGNLLNGDELRQSLFTKGVGLASSCDTETLTQMLAAAVGRPGWSASATSWPGPRGLLADHPDPRCPLCRAGPWGIRPLSIGRINEVLGGGLGARCRPIGACDIKEIPRGTIVAIDADGPAICWAPRRASQPVHL